LAPSKLNDILYGPAIVLSFSADPSTDSSTINAKANRTFFN